jgi:hypothetical protein
MWSRPARPASGSERLEVLACPHCSRMFAAAPAIFGKTIRCRGCRKPFRIPRDPSVIEQAPVAEDVRHRILVAVECVVDGVDARRCPACSRAFSMQPQLMGKTIRCRGCRVPFYVTAASPLQPQAEESKTRPSVQSPPNPREPRPNRSLPERLHSETSAAASPVAITEDGGDVLDAEPADEPVMVAIRPRPHWVTPVRYEPIRGPFRSGRF